MDYISLQDQILERRAGWQAGENEVSLLADDVFKGMLGDDPAGGIGSSVLAAGRVAMNQAPVTLPRRYDWRNRPGGSFLSPVRNQGPCGSCSAFAVVATIEAAILIQNERRETVDLSEADLFFCGGGGCSTGLTVEAALCRAKDRGVALEASFPYVAHDLACVETPPAYHVTSWLTLQSHAQRKQALVEDGPLVGRMQVFADFRAYVGGVYEYVSGPLVGHHAVCIVGYDDEDGCWLVKNSWSERFGEAGYVRIRYGQCCIDDVFPFYGLTVEKST